MADLSLQELQNLYHLARNVALRADLDAFEEKELRGILAAIDKAKKEITERFEKSAAAMTDWTADRLERLFYELDEVSAGIRVRLADETLRMAEQAGKLALAEHNSILSYGGRVPVFSEVAFSAAQYRAFFVETPLDGNFPALSSWINRAFSTSMRKAMLTDLQAGALQGEGYPALVRRLTRGFNLFKKDAVTIARTYVQAANVKASKDVAMANTDILRGWRWSAVLELGFIQSGTGTCLRCAVLDGQEFPIGGGPPIPLHPRCRCVPIWLTKTWRDLGIDMDEMEEVMRPWTKRPDKSIDEGGRRTILEVGFHQGSYGEWLMKQDEESKLAALGPGKLAWLKAGGRFEDLLDDQWRVKTLEELERR